MKNVLIIAHFWPYRGGSGRVLGLAKYLSEFGWQPIIITAPLDQKPEFQFRVIETPCPSLLDSVKRFLGSDPIQSKGRTQKQRIGAISKASQVRPFIAFFYNIIMAIVAYPDIFKAWKPFAIKACKELLQNEEIDAIVSIWPVTSHIIAKELNDKYKIPWIADFPDLWSQNHFYKYGLIRKLVDRRLERRTIRHADVLTTVSQPWAKKLGTLHKGKTVYSITHGFDPDTVNILPANLALKFTIIYSGSIYRGKQDTSKLFTALQDLISNGVIGLDDVEVRFYGNKQLWLSRQIEKYGLSSIVKLHERVPRQIVIEKQRESQLLLLLNWEDQREKGVYPLKIFEYLAAQRPILATGGYGNDGVEGLLNATKAGVYCMTVEDIKRTVSELYSEYRSKGTVSYSGKIEEINNYSYREMARKYAEILDGIAC